jgi:hypothetical protein
MRTALAIVMMGALFLGACPDTRGYVKINPLAAHPLRHPLALVQKGRRGDA